MLLKFAADGDADSYSCCAADHCPYKEWAIADQFFKPSGRHAREHHSQRHYAGGYGIVGCASPSLCKVDEIKHIGCRSEAIAELLDQHADIDHQQGLRGEIGQPDKGQTGQ